MTRAPPRTPRAAGSAPCALIRALGDSPGRQCARRIDASTFSARTTTETVVPHPNRTDAQVAGGLAGGAVLEPRMSLRRGLRRAFDEDAVGFQLLDLGVAHLGELAQHLAIVLALPGG